MRRTGQRSVIVLLLVSGAAFGGCHSRDTSVYYSSDGSVTVVERHHGAGHVVAHVMGELLLHALFCH